MVKRRFPSPNSYSEPDLANPTTRSYHDRDQPDRQWEDIGLHVADILTHSATEVLERGARAISSGIGSY